MKEDSVTIHMIAPDLVASAADSLTNEELIHAKKFRFDDDRRRWKAYRAALRRILGKEIGVDPLSVPLVHTAFGKPLLDRPYERLNFNLSHSPDLALLALSYAGPVGIDIEANIRAKELLECIDTFCHPKEVHHLPSEEIARADALMDIWTAKEAMLKALGTGLSHPPESVCINFKDGTAESDLDLPGLEGQRLYRLQHPMLSSYRAMLSAPPWITTIDILAPSRFD